MLEECEHAESDNEHESPDTNIAILPMQLRHVLEIHTVNSNNKSEWYEDGGDDREDAHHFVSAHAQT